MILNPSKLRMIEPLLSTIDIKLTASQVAKKQSLNQKSTQLYFDVLEKKGILRSEYQGNNKLFFWNKDNSEMVKNYMLAVEQLRTLHFYETNPKIKQIVTKINQHIKGIAVLFGSYANNTQNAHSDIDLLIIGKYDEKQITQITKLFSIDISIKVMKKYEVNPLTIEVQKNHIILKNAELFLTEAIKWIN